MKRIVILLLLSYVISLNCSAVFFVDINSFIGSYYYPERTDKEFNYYDVQDVRFGLKNISVDNLNLAVTLNYSENLTDYTIGLKKLQVSYEGFNNWQLAYLIDNLGYGKASEYFEQDLTNPDYRLHRLGDYRFSGINLEHKLLYHITAAHFLGGNKHNTVIGTSALKWNLNPLSIKLFYLHTGRDNNFNKTMHSIGFETELQTTYVEFFHSQSWQHLNSVFKKTNYLTYSELLFSFTPELIAGGNFFYAKEYRGFSSWQDYSLLTTYQLKSLNNTLIFSHTSANDLRKSKLTAIISYSFTESFSLGINGATHLPKTNRNYYSLGFQVKINEKYPF
ncbi:MAG: hypothetical protein K0B81_04715 [Candidatus Cloacimonetes bacterium]|nr:hypothetical protein [Candidatus Cloacimonadota bacterium]